MNLYTELLISIVIGYLLGSIPFALVIGKVFYKTDVRKFGSGNLGGTNTGRVLGKKAGATVMALDILKVVVAIFITSHFKNYEVTTVWTGFAAAIGHCYPIFAGFKGGKAVATLGGFIIGVSAFTFKSVWFIAVPLALFLIVLKTTKMVSLSSICAAIISAIQICIFVPLLSTKIASLLFAILVVYRHRANIERIINKTESKITWM